MLDMPPAHELTPITAECIEVASRRFDLPQTLLYSILQVEGGQLGQKNLNTNGTYDLGPMQINTLWLKKFSPYVNEELIANNGCINLMVGAWILRANINETGDFWQGVGNYHSRTPDKHERYKLKVYQASQQLR